MVVRYQGGDNAGHIVVIGDEVFKHRLVPSGVLHAHITPVIGSGVVINPCTLITEMDTLAERGMNPSHHRVRRAAMLAQEAFGGRRLHRRGVGPSPD